MDEDELQGGEDIMYSDFFGQSLPRPRAEATELLFSTPVVVVYCSAAGRLAVSLKAALAPLSRSACLLTLLNIMHSNLLGM